jgi:hypothetical protein
LETKSLVSIDWLQISLIYVAANTSAAWSDASGFPVYPEPDEGADVVALTSYRADTNFVSDINQKITADYKRVLFK